MKRFIWFERFDCTPDRKSTTSEFHLSLEIKSVIYDPILWIDIIPFLLAEWIPPKWHLKQIRYQSLLNVFLIKSYISAMLYQAKLCFTNIQEHTLLVYIYYYLHLTTKRFLSFLFLFYQMLLRSNLLLLLFWIK
jgi:hypothetical protein